MSTFTNRVGLPRYIWGHPSNRGNRWHALADAVAFQLRARVLRRDTIVHLGEGVRITTRPGSTAASKFVYAKPPDWPHMILWDQALKPGDLFLDVGANIGGYTLWVARLGAQVIAFEPVEEIRAELKANLDMNPSIAVEVLPYALADTPGTAAFKIEGSTSRLSALGQTLVETATLDEVLGARYAAGVKIDVEGAERLVLEGASRALAERRIGLLQLEWNACSQELLGENRQPIIELLQRYDYEVFRPLSPTLREAVRGDLYGDDVFARPRCTSDQADS